MGVRIAKSLMSFSRVILSMEPFINGICPYGGQSDEYCSRVATV